MSSDTARPTLDKPVSELRVALFATCFNDTMWPETPKATVRLLERLGVTVEFPAEQTCCGQMLTNTGYGRDALPLVRRFVDVFGEAGQHVRRAVGVPVLPLDAPVEVELVVEPA